MSFEDNKKRILAKLENEFEDKLMVIGELVASAARENSPVKTGRLKGSMGWRTKQNGISDDDSVSEPEKKLTVRIGTNVEYAKHHEFGTRFIRRKSMIRLALYENRNLIKGILRD